ncbi:MAG: hypothetical protein OEV28_00790 [Nitrospirota bacterium]|nr:hypothetical protein [Nitrospirota bacterium]
MPAKPYIPLSLAQHFEAPVAYLGCFGWVCGYSADAIFMDDAAERFTRQTHAQRAYNGRITLAMMLDPGISQIDVPGVAHLPIRDINEKPFRLMHAKVAILGFRHETDAEQWQLRLIVSTGNWTRETLEKTLDLAWRVDLASDDLKNSSNTIRQACADIRSAEDLFSWLCNYYDTRILDALPPGRTDSESVHAKRLFESWIMQAAAKAGWAKSRFFDTREKPLLAQLPAMIEKVGKAAKRNYLALGSGFYEATSENNVIPVVLGKIVETLKHKQLLTANPEVDVFVNPNACQAVAASYQALIEAGFTVRPAGQPDLGQKLQRTLHAKFIFGANCRENSALCNSAWLYLGSGNLTSPGFTNKASTNGGNLEAGVVLIPEDIYWRDGRGVKSECVITNLLPVQWETDVSDLPESLDKGADMPERDCQFVAAPVAWLYWNENADKRWLTAADDATVPFEVLDDGGEPCYSDGKRRFLWVGNRPRFVRLRWDVGGQMQESTVSILDEYGRLAATALPEIDLDEAWWQLANFPMPPDDEELVNEDDQVAQSATRPQLARPTLAAVYPIRQMMQLVENIAAKQTAISEVDWASWCTRLEQCLIQATDSSVVEVFREKIKINPLSPLWHAPFRPAFAETAYTEEGQRYEDALRRVEMEWNVASLTKIGGCDETGV